MRYNTQATGIRSALPVGFGPIVIAIASYVNVHYYEVNESENPPCMVISQSIDPFNIHTQGVNYVA